MSRKLTDINTLFKTILGIIKNHELGEWSVHYLTNRACECIRDSIMDIYKEDAEYANEMIRWYKMYRYIKNDPETISTKSVEWWADEIYVRWIEAEYERQLEDEKRWEDDLAQAYKDNAEMDKKMADELIGVSYEVDKIMEKEFIEKYDAHFFSKSDQNICSGEPEELSPEEYAERLKDYEQSLYDAGVLLPLSEMKGFTQEESDEYEDALDKLSQPTGISFFDGDKL